MSIQGNGAHTNNNSARLNPTNINELNLCLNLNLTKEQQKQMLNSVKLTDPPSLLKELLKHRSHNILLASNNSINNNSTSGAGNIANGADTNPRTCIHHHKNSHRKSSGTHSHHKNKFNCYSGNATSSDCDCECDDATAQIEESNKMHVDEANQLESTPSKASKKSVNVLSPNVKKLNDNNESSDDNENGTISNSNVPKENGTTNRRISGRNLIKVLNESEKPTSKNTNNATNFCNTANSMTTSMISNGKHFLKLFKKKTSDVTVS